MNALKFIIPTVLCILAAIAVRGVLDLGREVKLPDGAVEERATKVEGWLDAVEFANSRLILRGWVLDRANNTAPASVVVYADHWIVANVPVTQARPDIVARFKLADGVPLGYAASVSAAEIARLDDPTYRIFARLADGRVGELRYHPDVPLKTPFLSGGLSDVWARLRLAFSRIVG